MEPWGNATFAVTDQRLSVINHSVHIDMALADVVSVYELGEPNGATTEIEIEQRDGSTFQLMLNGSALSNLLDRLAAEAERSNDSATAAAEAGSTLADPATPISILAADDSLQTVVAEVAVAPPPYLGSPQPSPTTSPLPTGPEPTPQKACPYCQTTADGDVTECPACHATHHRDCWVESGGCAMVGCAQTTGSTSPSAPPAAHPQAAAPWTPAGPAAPPQSAQTIAWPGTTTPSAPSTAWVGAAGSSAAPGVRAARTRRTWPKLMVGLLLIGLPIAAVAATANNWFEPLVGRLYTATELRAAEASARNAGRTQGYDSGYDEGKAAGVDEGFESGFESGFEAGCTAVFDAADSSLLYDSPSFSYSYGTRTYVSKSSCYG